MQQLRVTREVNFTGATQIGVGSNNFSVGKGKTYYADDAGSDGYEGTNPNYPLLTTTAAIAKCSSTSNGDAVVVMQRSPSTAVTGETWPINLDKPCLLTGLYSRGLVSDSGFGSTPTNTDCITVGANFCSVENLYLQVTTGTTGDVIAGPASGARYGFTLRNSWIGLQNTSRYGFHTGAATDFPYLLIEDCVFSAPNATNMTSAIRLFNASFSVIRRNLFLHCSSYAIHVLGSCLNTSVLDNRFDLSEDTAGFAIQCAAGSRYNFFDGNSAASQDTATDPTVFTDASTAGYNKWGNNYAGIVAVLAT